MIQTFTTGMKDLLENIISFKTKFQYGVLVKIIIRILISVENEHIETKLYK